MGGRGSRAGGGADRSLQEDTARDARWGAREENATTAVAAGTISCSVSSKVEGVTLLRDNDICDSSGSRSTNETKQRRCSREDVAESSTKRGTVPSKFGSCQAR